MNQVQRTQQSLSFKICQLLSSIDHSSVVLSPALEDFVKAYAESVHDQWSYAKVSQSLPGKLLLQTHPLLQIEQGWTYGEQINDKYRQHPNLKPYKLLNQKASVSFSLLFLILIKVNSFRIQLQ